MTRIIAIVSALGLITLLMCLVITLQKTELLTPEKTMVREINLAVPPPPPPPPPANQQAQFDAAPSLELNVDGAGPEIQFAQVELAGKTELANLPLPEMSQASTNFSDSLRVDWQAFGLEELDNVPRLLTSSSQFTIKYPQSLLRRGIRSAEVELDVLIEESGKVILRGFVHNPYPELAPLVEDLMHKARFTSPKKDGLPVRATFTWPMEFGNS